jgi:stearoyl-CoA desaturase (delta-9 desaturase)
MLPRYERPARRRADEQIDWRATAPFVLVNLLPLLAFVTGVTTTALVLFVVLYVSRAFFVTAGYHRYFAHRSYRMARVPQLLMAIGGSTAVQKGPLWWAQHHRDHHRYADTDRDPHSPQRGFWWSHILWFVSERYATTDLDAIEDFAVYPELRWLNRHDWVAPWALGVTCWLIGGWSGLVFGFFASTVLLWHATFAVNSFAHIIGTRRYATSDSSRNNVVIALLTLGEGWHNNHHHYPLSARQGFRWWQIDISYALLRFLSIFGIVRGLRGPPPTAVAARPVKGNVDVGMVRYHLAQAAAVLADAPCSSSDELYQLLGETAEQAAVIGRQRRLPERVG